MVDCGKYSAGMLQSRIVIRRKTRTPDGAGGVTETWSDIGTPWAYWTKPSGREVWGADRTMPMASVKAVIRFRGDANGNPFYTAADRVEYRGRQYAVISARDADDRQEWIELSLTEGGPS